MSGPPIQYTCPITVCGCQNRITKSADLPRTQAGRTQLGRKYATRTIGYSGIPNYALKFAGGF
jgi:hypothetical protein